MRRLLVLVALLVSGCGGTAKCTEAVHPACDLDGGSGCSTRQSCLLAASAVDPCPAQASACCFDACTDDKGCPANQRCLGGACMQGRCAADAGL
jgi:hypothetical protein